MDSNTEQHHNLHPDSLDNHEKVHSLAQKMEDPLKESECHEHPVEREYLAEETEHSNQKNEIPAETTESNGFQTFSSRESSHQDSHQPEHQINATDQHVEHEETHLPESGSPKVHSQTLEARSPVYQSNESHHEAEAKENNYIKPQDHLTENKADKPTDNEVETPERVHESSKVKINGVSKHEPEEDSKHEAVKTHLEAERTSSERINYKNVLNVEKSPKNSSQNESEQQQITHNELKNDQRVIKFEQNLHPQEEEAVEKQNKEDKHQDSVKNPGTIGTQKEFVKLEQEEETLKKFSDVKEVNSQIIIRPLPTIASLSSSREEFIEQIPVDKLDCMSTYERFTEFEFMIEKGLSLKNRNKLENAASVFENAVDIMNPIYFRDSPKLLPKVQKCLAIGLCSAASCQFAIDRYYDAAKNSHYAYKLDSNNLEALFYLGTSRKKLGDINEAARVFLIAKRTRGHANNKLFKEKIIAQLGILEVENPELDTKKIEENVLAMLRRSKRSVIFAVGGFIPGLLVMYLISKRLRMPKRRVLLTSISSGVILGVISFLLRRRRY